MNDDKGLVERFAGHTPGPWRLGADLRRVHLNWRDEDGSCSPSCYHRNGSAKTIATVIRGDDDWRDIGQAVADGYLIAEAPNLLARIQVLSDRIAVLEGLAEQAALALNPFIYIIAHRFDGDGSYYWMRDPTHDEAQAAMAATNAVSAALTPQESSSNAE